LAGLGNSQFRESAVVANAQPEPLDDRAELTAPREWAVLACLGLAVAAIILWGALGSVERTWRSDGALVLSGDRGTVLSSRPGTVIEIASPAGERVVAGQTVVRLVPAGIAQPLDLAAASALLLEPDTQGAGDAERAEARRLLAAAQALLDRSTAVHQDGAVVSPDDGVIAATFVAPGQTIPAGVPVAEIVSGEAASLEAVAFAAPADAWRLDTGMTARVTVESAEGVRSFPAELAEIAPRAAAPPGWLARMRPEIPARERGHVIRFALSIPQGIELPPRDVAAGGLEDGTPCRIEVVLERTSPFALVIGG